MADAGRAWDRERYEERSRSRARKTISRDDGTYTYIQNIPSRRLSSGAAPLLVSTVAAATIRNI